MLSDSLISVVGLDIGMNEAIELGFWGVKVLGTTLGSMDKLSLGTYDDTDLGSTYGTTYDNFEIVW